MFFFLLSLSLSIPGVLSHFCCIVSNHLFLWPDVKLLCGLLTRGQAWKGLFDNWIRQYSPFSYLQSLFLNWYLLIHYEMSFLLIFSTLFLNIFSDYLLRFFSFYFVLSFLLCFNFLSCIKKAFNLIFFRCLVQFLPRSFQIHSIFFAGVLIHCFILELKSRQTWRLRRMFYYHLWQEQLWMRLTTSWWTVYFISSMYINKLWEETERC